MKRIKFFAMMLAMIASIGFFASCGGDDKEDTPPGGGDEEIVDTPKSFLVGTWKSEINEHRYMTWTFLEDGNGFTVNYYDGEIRYTDTFTYKIDEKNQKVELYYPDCEFDEEDDTFRYSKVSDVMIYVFNWYKDVEEWHKQ